MQYVIIAQDKKDKNSYKRRLSAREKHIELADKMKTVGKLLFACALLNKKRKMCGSIMIFSFKNKQEFNDWFKIEPYITQKIWGKIEIKICKIGPSFSKSKTG